MLARWTLLLRRLALVFILYGILRGLFLFCNRRFFRDIGIEQIGLAFLQGFRFDLSAIIAINFLFIFLTIFPRRVEPPPGYERLLKWVFLITNIPLSSSTLSIWSIFNSMAAAPGWRWSSWREMPESGSLHWCFIIGRCY